MKRIVLLSTELSALGLSAGTPVAGCADTSGVLTHGSGPIGPPAVS